MAQTDSPTPYMPMLVILLIVAAFLIGTMYTKISYLEKGTPPSTQAQVPNQPTPTPTPKPLTTGHFPVLGNKNAKVTIIEFADFRCPFCERFFTETEPQILKDYVDKGLVQFAFRQYAFLGPASTVAANGAECAHEQEKFWQYHDYLYKNQPPESDISMYTVDKLTSVAESLKLDSAKFRDCLQNNKYSANVSTDLSEGQIHGVNGTPTTFINGKSIVGAQPYENFKTEIEAALKVAK